MADILTFNACGLGDPRKLLELFKVKKALNGINNTIYLIQETKLSKLSAEHEKIINFEKHKYILHPCTNNSGGLLTIFPANFDMATLLKNHSGIVLKNEATSTLFVNVYINPKDYFLEEFGDIIEEITKYQNYSIFIGGDFNAINIKDEIASLIKVGDIRAIRYKRATNMMTPLAIHELPMNNKFAKHTHVDKRTGALSRIDYFFSNCNQNQYNIINAICSSSDHRLVLAKTNREDIYGQSYWKLNDSILKQKETIKTLLETAINEYKEREDIILWYDHFKARIRDRLRILAIRANAASNAKEKEILREIEYVEGLLYSSNCNEKTTLLKSLNEKYIELREIRTTALRTKMKSIKDFYLEANEGDSKSVNTLCSLLKKEKSINSLKLENGEQTNDIDKILDAFTEHYDKLGQHPSARLDYDKIIIEQNEIVRKFSEENSQSINDIIETQKEIEEITETEIEKAIEKLNPNSAPGNDGLTSNLYKQNREFFIPLLCTLFNKSQEVLQLPKSFENAIMKMIPKKEKSEKVTDYRPISLINTDQKILSHVLAERLKKPLENVIHHHQFAHLENRNIQNALFYLRLNALKLSSKNAMVAIDFSKAFDKIDRRFILELLRVIGISPSTLNLIRSIYAKTSSFIEISGFISKKIPINIGVRQGCPLSAVLFNLGIEPLLQQISTSNCIKGKLTNRVVAYADDITCCVLKTDVPVLMFLIDNFCEKTLLALNHDKTEIICNGDIQEPFEKKNQMKLLGVKLNTSGKCNNPVKQQLMDIVDSGRKFCLKSMTLKARAKNLETFVFSKLLYQLRNVDVTKGFLEKMESKLIDNIWLNKKHCVSKEVLYAPPASGGIGLKNIHILTATAKLMTIRNICLENNENSFKLISRSNLYRRELQFLRKYDISIEAIFDRTFTLRHKNRSLLFDKTVSFKMLYRFLIEEYSSYSKSLISLNKTSFKLGFSPNILQTFFKNFWSDSRFSSFDKNILFSYFHNAYLDKQKKWEVKLVQHPLCFACEEEFETYEHLFLNCQKFSKVRLQLSVTSWKNSFADTTRLQLRFLVAIILSSWLEERSEYLKWFENIT